MTTPPSAPSIPQNSFYFLRHGQTQWNLEGRFQGHTDIPLDETGRSQAHAAATSLARCPVDLIVASPLVRARTTAEIVAKHLGKPLLLDDDLKERHFGAFEGLVVNEVKAQFGLQPYERLVRHLPADAEQWHETCARTMRVIGQWLGRHPGQTLLFVAHAGLFDALHAMILGSRVESKHAPYYWRHSETGWSCSLV